MKSLNPLSAGKSVQTLWVKSTHETYKRLNPLFYAFFETVFLRKAQEVCSDNLAEISDTADTS